MGCIPMRKSIITSTTETNTNYNNKKSQISNQIITTPYQNISQFKPKTTIEQTYKIIQKINTHIQHAYKIIHKTNQNIYTMITLLKSSITNTNTFIIGYNNIIKVKHKNILSIYDIYEDSYCYYLICEHFDGNKLYDECNIEIDKYNEYTLSRIIKKLMKVIIKLKQSNINNYYVDPQNIFCNFTSNKKIIIKVFYNQFFIDNNNTYDKVKNAFCLECFTNKREESSLGVLMYMMLFGNIHLLNENEFFEEKVFTQIKKSSISLHPKQLLLHLLQLNNNTPTLMNYTTIFKSEFFSNSDPLPFDNTLLSNISFFFNEICFYYKILNFYQYYIYMNNSLILEMEFHNSKTNTYSLFNMHKEKIENEEPNMNVISFLNDIRVFRIKQQMHQLRRIFTKIDNRKEKVMEILELNGNDVFKRMVNELKEMKCKKVDFDELFQILFEKVNEGIGKDKNYIGKLVGRYQSVDMKNFNKEFIVIANKWYSSEDCFDMESFMNGHCSSSDIDSSENEEG